MFNNLRVILKKTIAISLFLTILVLLPMLQFGCFKPVAALTFVNRDIQSDSANPVYSRDSESLLDSHTERSIQRYGTIIQKYSEKYDMDWRLVLAVMRHESRFHPTATSYRGAFGLMQIMPTTQVELLEKLGIDEAQTPHNNIRAGTYHLRTLYKMFGKADHFNRIRLTLAAYNAGLGRILDAQDVAAYLGDDPNNWESVKAALPFLSKRHYTLHKRIWDGGRPRSGYLRDWRQPKMYVESVMQYYDEYQLALR